MIRTRLTTVFAALAVLALAQSLFAWWAATSAAHHAERSVMSTRMLAEYLEISGDKQRLKVWFAQRMLTGDMDLPVREALMASMFDSLGQMRSIAQQMPAAIRAQELLEVETVALNIAELERALLNAEEPASELPPDQQWRMVLLAFDELLGRDMRELLRGAVGRHEGASLQASGDLATALTQVRNVGALLAVAVAVIALVSVVYFLRRLKHPFTQLARLSEALAAGDFGSRSGLSGRGEFEQIGTLLDSMAERLSQAQSRSLQLQQQLDTLVAERTRALSHAYESLLEIEARRRQFFAELSHELRTPVTVIRGEAEVALRGRAEPTDQRQTLVRIIEATSELANRIRDLLEAASAGSFEYAMTIGRVSLHDVMHAAVDQMSSVAAHRGSRLELDASTPDTTGMVAADRERLQQALVIVLDNAIRYSPPGSRIRVSLSKQSEHWEMHVVDDGPGMPIGELEHAFDLHYRGLKGRQRDPQGHGLGLAIARKIIEALHGDIELGNIAPHGLRVSMALPMLKPGQRP